MADVIETFADGTVIERDFTAAELAQIETDKATQLAKQAEAEAKAAQKAALLDRLGITEDEARLLLG
jgi:hypothetical protein